MLLGRRGASVRRRPAPRVRGSLVLLVAVTSAWAAQCAATAFCRSAQRPRTAREKVQLRAWQEAALGAWSRYEGLLETQGLLTDVGTASTINSLSDSIAQSTEWLNSTDNQQRVLDGARIMRYAVYGSVDGVVGHNWCEALDNAAVGWGNSATVLKVAADSAVYTPCLCAIFLVLMALLEGRGVAVAAEELRRDFWDLLRGNYGLTLPFVALIYGAVPVRFQVAAFAMLTLAYTIVLSLWANARQRATVPSVSMSSLPEGLEPSSQQQS